VRYQRKKITSEMLSRRLTHAAAPFPFTCLSLLHDSGDLSLSVCLKSRLGSVHIEISDTHDLHGNADTFSSLNQMRNQSTANDMRIYLFVRKDISEFQNFPFLNKYLKCLSKKASFSFKFFSLIQIFSL